MSDPFNILGQFEEPKAFDAAVGEALAKFQASVDRFAELQAVVPEDAFTPDEWRLVELAAAQIEEAAERADEGYVAVQYDSHAWYRIMESLETLHLRLESTIGLMERVRERCGSSS
jgi:hypothetical protein